MLQVSVDDANNFRLAPLPAVNHGSSQTPRIAPHQEPYPWIGLTDRMHNLSRSILAVVVHYNDFVGNSKRIEAAPNSLQDGLNVARFMQRRQDQSEFCLCLRNLQLRNMQLRNKDRRQRYVRRIFAFQNLWMFHCTFRVIL